jgi:hypothetical protein
MEEVVHQLQRIIKPSGSAMFVLQPNYEHLGQMRLWLWEFMVWCGREWNIVQDCYWWNFTTMPGGGQSEKAGLMRSSVKTCLWLGAPDCYRNQRAVWMKPANTYDIAERLHQNAIERYPSGHDMKRSRASQTVIDRGGVSPMNLLPIPRGDSTNGGGSYGHSGSTPEALLDWWIRYISKPGDIALDPFIGVGTTALVARRLERHYIGIDNSQEYVEIAKARLRNTDPYQDTEMPDGNIQKGLWEGKY